jgi:hypothetical protein
VLPDGVVVLDGTAPFCAGVQGVELDAIDPELLGFVFPLLGLLLALVPVPGVAVLADGVAVAAGGVAVLAHGVAVFGIPPGMVPGVVCPEGVRF